MDNFSGRKTITENTNPLASNAERLSDSSSTFSRVDVYALSGNAGVVWVGFAGTSARSGYEAGAPLAAGDSYTFHGGDMNELLIAGTSDGDGVSYNVETT